MSSNLCNPGGIESVHDLMRRQFGVISAAQASRLGMSKHAVAHRVRTGQWTRVLPRVYRVTAAPVVPQQEAIAAVLWAGAGALVSHSWAALLLGFEGMRAAKVELWVPSTCKVNSPLVTVHRGTRLDRADRTVLDGIPITTPVRTLIDMSARLEDGPLLALTESLLRQGLVTEERLAARLGALRASGRPGAGRLEALLDERGDGRPLESPLEVTVWRLIVESGLPLPARQHWVTVTRGRYRLDFAWPDRRVGVECMGYAHHGGRARWGKDMNRFAELAAVNWRVVPVTWDACTRRRDQVLAQLRMAYAPAA